MTSAEIIRRVHSQLNEPLSLPGRGQTAFRHEQLWAFGFEDLSFARIAEAHWDAIAILAECGHEPESEIIYGVWASELPGHALRWEDKGGTITVSGRKMFCSGTGLVDRALVTVGTPEKLLVDVDLRSAGTTVTYDTAKWATQAFRETQTGNVTFTSCRVDPLAVLGSAGWYLDRPGFWHGACGPAACWAGGAEALVSYAKANSRRDAHTLAHLGAMHSNVWAMRSCLESAGREIDADPDNYQTGLIRALAVRHIVEQHSSDILRRFTRAYGPFPLAMDADISQRCQELDLYLRQSHAERDLEMLGIRLLAKRDFSIALSSENNGCA